jgi:hypothetical protein
MLSNKRIISQNNNLKPSVIYKTIGDQSPFEYEYLTISADAYKKKNKAYYEFLSKRKEKGLEENFNYKIINRNTFRYSLDNEQMERKINSQVKLFVTIYESKKVSQSSSKLLMLKKKNHEK